MAAVVVRLSLRPKKGLSALLDKATQEEPVLTLQHRITVVEVAAALEELVDLLIRQKPETEETVRRKPNSPHMGISAEAVEVVLLRLATLKGSEGPVVEEMVPTVLRLECLELLILVVEAVAAAAQGQPALQKGEMVALELSL